MKKTKKKRKDIYLNPKYAGKHILIAGDKVFATSDTKKASRMFDEIVKKYHIVPTVTYIPKGNTLILWL